MKALMVVVILSGCLAPNAGCVSGRQEVGTLPDGMSRAEVLRSVGKPAHVASAGGAEYFGYDVQKAFGFVETHYVKLVDGSVESHGKAADYPEAPRFRPGR